MRWIIGDIHGMHKPLEALLQGVRAVDANPRWIFVGDYVNRGPDSKAVIERLLTLENARFCRGNHDDIFDCLINHQSYAQQLTGNNRAAVFKWFMEHGLAQTLRSYGASDADLTSQFHHPTHEGLDALAALVPIPHRLFIRNLAPVIEEPDIFITHARWDIKLPDEKPSLTDALAKDPALRQTITWGRFTAEELDQPKPWRRTGVFGHTPVDSYGARGGFNPHGGGSLVPIVAEKVVLIDTACALSPAGRLTAWCAEQNGFMQVDRHAKIVTE